MTLEKVLGRSAPNPVPSQGVQAALANETVSGGDRKPEPSVCIVLLNWNGWRNTLSCLESLDQLEYRNYRTLLIDNGSSDDSVERIRQARPGLHLVRTDRNLGFGGGCNVGIRIALDQGADYVWFLNNDTKVCAHALTALVECAQSDKRIGAVGSMLYCMDAAGTLQCRGGGKVNRLIGWARWIRHSADGAGIDYICGASLLMPARTLREVGGFDDDTFFMYSEDVDLSLRLRQRGWRLAVASASNVQHIGFASLGKDSPLLIYHQTMSNVLLYWKYYPALLPAVLLVALRAAVRWGLVFEIRKLLAAYKGIGDALRRIHTAPRLQATRTNR